MGDILKGLVNIFTGGAGAAVGTAATVAGVVVALAPVGIFLMSDKSEQVFISVTYREAAFWGAMIAVNLLVAWMTKRNAS